jgi:acetylglutamate kinase
MRLVLRVAQTAASHRDYGGRFARAVAELVQDGHFLTVIHGQNAAPQPLAVTSGAHSKNGHDCEGVECAKFTPAELENRVLVTVLAEAGVTSIGLHATDAGLVKLRKGCFGNAKDESRVEAAGLDSCWLEIICSNKGVPVLSNLAFWTSGERHLIDADRMAAVCAADWKADALIYLTEESGVPNAHGDVLRWFDIGSTNGLYAMLDDRVRALVEACAMALRGGVRRVRILPLSKVDCLPLFYFSSIEYGTEVIAVSPSV